MARRRKVKAPKDRAYEVREIEIGGSYETLDGKVFVITRRTARGVLLVGLGPSGEKGFFTDDGRCVDRADNRLHWYARGLRTHPQIVALQHAGLWQTVFADGRHL